MKNKGTRRSAPKVRPPEAGKGNPHWFRAYVTASRYQNWKLSPRDASRGTLPKESPLTLSAGPGLEDERVTVRLGQSLSLERPLELQIEFCSPMRGRRIKLSEPITLVQAYSFEEAVRAVFRAAREEGVLPAPAGGPKRRAGAA